MHTPSTALTLGDAVGWNPSEAIKAVVTSDKDENEDTKSSALAPTEDPTTNVSTPTDAHTAIDVVHPVQTSASEVGSDELAVDSNVRAPVFRNIPDFEYYLRLVRLHNDGGQLTDDNDTDSALGMSITGHVDLFIKARARLTIGQFHSVSKRQYLRVYRREWANVPCLSGWRFIAFPINLDHITNQSSISCPKRRTRAGAPRYPSNRCFISSIQH